MWLLCSRPGTWALWLGDYDGLGETRVESSGRARRHVSDSVTCPMLRNVPIPHRSSSHIRSCFYNIGYDTVILFVPCTLTPATRQRTSYDNCGGTCWSYLCK